MRVNTVKVAHHDKLFIIIINHDDDDDDDKELASTRDDADKVSRIHKAQSSLPAGIRRLFRRREHSGCSGSKLPTRPPRRRSHRNKQLRQHARVQQAIHQRQRGKRPREYLR